MKSEVDARLWRVNNTFVQMRKSRGIIYRRKGFYSLKYIYIYTIGRAPPTPRDECSCASLKPVECFRLRPNQNLTSIVLSFWNYSLSFTKPSTIVRREPMREKQQQLKREKTRPSGTSSARLYSSPGHCCRAVGWWLCWVSWWGTRSRRSVHPRLRRRSGIGLPLVSLGATILPLPRWWYPSPFYTTNNNVNVTATINVIYNIYVSKL